MMAETRVVGIDLLPATAGLAIDLVRDTGELAGEYGHVGATFLSNHIHPRYLPRGKKSAAAWVDGFAMLFGVIHEIFDAGRVPTADELVQTLSLTKDKNQKKLLRAYAKNGAGSEEVLGALVKGAKYDWEEGDFEDTYSGSTEWDTLPTCAKHDFDWSLAEDVLTG